jgi:glutamate dehydrogenase
MKPSTLRARRPVRQALAARLLRAWRNTLPPGEWRLAGAGTLRDAAAAQLQFAAVRRARQTLVRVHSATQAPESGNSYSVVELITDDMPFLVDTLTMTLTEAGHAVQLIAHPIVAARRSSTGRLLGFAGRGRGAAVQRPAVNESWQYLQISRVAGAQECAALQARIVAALRDVRRACEDWPAMRRIARSLREQLARQVGPQPAAAVAEAQALLEYVENDHFTFLGYERSSARRRGRTTQLLPERGSALGIQRGRRAAPLRTLATAGRGPGLLKVTKADRRSTVHRPGFLDCIVISRSDRRGRLLDESRFYGLWTSNTYHADPRTVPLLRLKVRQVIDSFPFRPTSHDGKRLVSILDNLPRDELFQASAAELRRCARTVLALHERPRGACLVLRRDEYRRYWSCLVYLGRERLDNEAFARISRLLQQGLGGDHVDTSLAVGDAPLAQLHVVVRTPATATQRIDQRRLERALNEALVTWRDRLRSALLQRFDEIRATTLERRYWRSFPPAYQQDVPPELAILDISDLEDTTRSVGSAQLHLRRSLPPVSGRLHLRLLRHGEPLPISDVLPILENFGLRVIAERPYELQLPHSGSAWLQDFELESHGAAAADLGLLEAQLVSALPAILAGSLDNDGFHRLVLSAGLTLPQTRLLRACCRYLLQTGIPFSQNYMERALNAHPHITRELWQLFDARFNPVHTEAYARRAARACERRLRHAIGEVRNPDEDRILRTYLALLLAITRCNYWCEGAADRPLAFKLLPREVPGLPEPRPAFEIFVHGTRVEGVHMRRGPIARGGIRWSERPEDFRTEILGLMKAQHVKNTLIVPVGAKGGFVARRLRAGAPADERAREVLACYQAFIRCLLEITDNIVDGRIVPPRQLRRRDGDDPYLVVAADKGTASYSDVANALSAECGFWLGDAFASGGSAGYDHKKMGITARGAFECVKRHFRELGLDIMRAPFTVAGIGDMSGDVFGNGMLLSPHIHLVAAFDHRHIFIDPAPDALRARRERARLFALPRSSWADYDARALSAGGAVYERSQKHLNLSAAARKLLEFGGERVTPLEVIRAILRLPVDLLWNGGIGTYVKGADERHGEIGDRANDAVRIDGRELRARVFGEGGNLGCSQRGRVEYAQTGGRINTDFIDNSAGVNTSDIEVNLKIMLAGNVGGRAPVGARRRALLASVTDEVAAQVLRNNYLQSQAISLLERRSVADLADHQQLLRTLERGGELNRALEFLPSDREIDERLARGQGLTRPELAILLAYGKIAMYHALGSADIGSDAYLGTELQRYFPQRWRARFAARIARHRLRAQLILTATTNSILNRMDPGFAVRMSAQTGADVGTVARAYTIARDSAGLRELWTAIEALDNRLATEVQYDALLMTRDYVEQLTRRLLLAQAGRELADIGAAVARHSGAFGQLRALLPALLPGIAHQRFLAEQAQHTASALPPALAAWLAALPALRATPDLVELARQARKPLPFVARQYFRTAAALGIDWLAEAIRELKTTGAWQAVARERLYTACLDGQRSLCARALRERAGEGEQLSRWCEQLGAPGAQWRLTLRELRATAAPDLAALMAGAEALRNLAQAGG